MLFKIGDLKNFAMFTGKHVCWRYFFTKLQSSSLVIFLKRRCFVVKMARELFKNTYFEEHLQKAASALLIIGKLVINIGHLPIFSSQLKYNMRWLLLRMFVGLVRTYSLLIVNRNPSNTFY